jgi:hypothetical protein
MERRLLPYQQLGVLLPGDIHLKSRWVVSLDDSKKLCEDNEDVVIRAEDDARLDVDEGSESPDSGTICGVTLFQNNIFRICNIF